MITIIGILLALVAGITLGYAARQRQDLEAAHDKIVELWADNANLAAENVGLRGTIRSHEFSLEMVLNEGRSS